MLKLPLHRLPDKVETLCLAISGGLDSRVLLHLLLEQATAYRIELWHVNYRMQDNADAMETLVRKLAAIHNLPLSVDTITLDPTQGNLEARARHARYTLFEGRLSENATVITAHQMNDQAESLLLNLMRGSGSRGLRAMSEIRSFGPGYLFRPLLKTTRGQIHQYALQHGLEWIEDPSNDSLTFDRNYLRREIIPRLYDRWPAVVENLERSAGWQQEQQQLLDDLAGLDQANVEACNRWSNYSCLSIKQLQRLSYARQKNLLRHWLDNNAKPSPGFRKLQQLLQQTSWSESTQAVVDFDSYSLRCYDDYLFIVDHPVMEPIQEVHVLTGDEDVLLTHLNFRLNRRKVLQQLGRQDQGEKLELRFRTGAGSIEPAFKHRLKRLYQRYRVPPWLRSSVPLVVAAGQLIDLLPPHSEGSWNF